MAQRFEADTPYTGEDIPLLAPGETGGRWDDPVAGGGGGGGCGPGTFPADVDAQGNRKEPDGECINAAEAARRSALWTAKTGIGADKGASKPGAPSVVGGPSAPVGPASYKFAPVPGFNAPQFQWDEEFRAPSYDEAASDPGYQFRVNEGRRALEQSAAGRGTLRTGGTLKDLLNYGQGAASQEYANVFDRYARGYDTRFGTAKDKFAFKYQGAKDEYSPKLFEWQTKTAFGTNAAQQAWQKAWESYFRNTLSASDILGAGR